MSENARPRKGTFSVSFTSFRGIMESRGIWESLKSKRLGTTEALRDRVTGGRPLLAYHLGAEAAPQGLCPRSLVRLSPEPTRTQPARPVTAAQSPRHHAAPRPARPPLARPSPLPARLRGRGWGGGGRRRRREEVGGATPATHWLPRPGPEAPPLWRGHVIPFKDGRPVVLMNNTWWGEGVRVGVEG